MCQISPRCSGCRSVAYDALGCPLTNGVFSYTYNASSRLASVSSNGVLLATFAYDPQGRRVGKISHRGTETRSNTYFYDGWTPVRETIIQSDNQTIEKYYFWGKDLSGSMQGAGGVGGLLYVSISNSSTPNSSTHQLYIPLYDANGNITRYCDASGNVVASYTYDAFGNTTAQSGAMADTFPHRFSTKYFDTETSLYYYGYRFYSPELMRWLNRDPIEEEGGANVYAFCGNNAILAFDIDGRSSVSIDMWTGKDPAPVNPKAGIFLYIKATYSGQLAKGSTLNFIQIMRGESQSIWKLDYEGSWPYYITPLDLKAKFEEYDQEGKLWNIPKLCPTRLEIE